MLATTKLSSNGKLTLPKHVRDKMGFYPGDQFIVFAKTDTVMLKIIHRPALDDFKALAYEARKKAKKVGITQDSVKDAIMEARIK